MVFQSQKTYFVNPLDMVAYATVTPQILGRQAPLISRKLNTRRVREMGRSKGR